MHNQPTQAESYHRVNPGACQFIGNPNNLDSIVDVPDPDEQAVSSKAGSFAHRVLRRTHDQPLENALVHARERGERTLLLDDQLLICRPFVRGYSMELHKWCKLCHPPRQHFKPEGVLTKVLVVEFDVSCINEVSWDEDLHDRLVLPDIDTSPILDLVKGQMSTQSGENGEIYGNDKE
jgi:hypothetical protein